jgi:ribosome-associated heat shock protein Hsp15
MPDNLDVIRLDKWLWAARFFKTRALAAEAISGGKVHVNSQRCKAGKEIKVGTQVNINKNDYSWEITVALISAQRRSAKEAALLYNESEESLQKRQTQIQEQRLQNELLPFSGIDHKPNKKERRLIHRFKDSQ